MPDVNLVVPTNITSTPQYIKDKNGNSSDLSVSSGNIGVNTVSPAKKLAVHCGNTDGIQVCNSSGTARLQLFLDASDNGIVRAIDSSNNVNVSISAASGTNSYIDAGNVGIGNTSPADKLEVSGQAIRITNAIPTLRLKQTSGDPDENWELELVQGKLHFYASNSDFSSATPRMTLLHDGYVGIGMASPDQKLDVDGVAKAQSLRADGDSGGEASTNTVTGSTDTPTSDPGWTTSDTSPMSAPDGYIKCFVGTQAVVVPYWNT